MRLVAVVLVLAAITATSALPAGTQPTARIGADPVQSASVAAPVTSVPNTSGYLSLPSGSVERRGVGSPQLDVTGALAADAAGIDGRFEAARLDRDTLSSGSGTVNDSVLRESADRLADRADALLARERSVRGQFESDALTTRQYLRRIAVIDARARSLRQALDRLRERNSEANGPVSRARLGAIRSNLAVLNGPVRRHIQQAMDGRTEPVRVSVATGSDGIVLGTVAPGDAEYVREAYVLDAHRPDEPDAYNGSYLDALDVLEDRYPWTFDNNDRLRIGDGTLLRVGVYRVTIHHSHGTLTTYLDGGSREVFSETQNRRLSTMPTGTTTSNADGGLSLEVTRSPIDGVLRVGVQDADTEAPVDAIIRVDGDVVTRTGSKEVIWIVSEAQTPTVTAAAGGRNVSVTVGA